MNKSWDYDISLIEIGKELDIEYSVGLDNKIFETKKCRNRLFIIHKE